VQEDRKLAAIELAVAARRRAVDENKRDSERGLRGETKRGARPEAIDDAVVRFVVKRSGENEGKHAGVGTWEEGPRAGSATS